MFSESNPFLNFVIGLLIGVGASFLYIRFGIQLPAAAGVGQRITSEAIVKTAELQLFDASNPPLVRHRALAMILAHEPEKFLAIDRAINHRFLNEFLRQHQTGFGLNGPIVLDQNPTSLKTISRSKLGTTLIGSNEKAAVTLGGTAAPNYLTKALLQQKYPDASADTIDFLAAHPELRSSPIQTGRQATLPGLKLKIDTETR